MRLFIVRHADPDYPNNTITERGHREASALAERFRRQGLDRVFSSPLGRAVHTAEYTAEALGLPVEIEDWTAELSHWRIDQPPAGSYCAWDLHGETIRRWRPLPTSENWHTYPQLDDPTMQREFAQLGEKSDAFLASLGYVHEDGIYRAVRPNREKIAVFCHGGFGLTWLSHLLMIPLPLMWAGFFLWPTSVSTVLLDERSEGVATPRCVGLADVSHLHAAGLEPAPSGIKANAE